jgi:hypothetical protein
MTFGVQLSKAKPAAERATVLDIQIQKNPSLNWGTEQLCENTPHDV